MHIYANHTTFLLFQFLSPFTLLCIITLSIIQWDSCITVSDAMSWPQALYQSKIGNSVCKVSTYILYSAPPIHAWAESPERSVQVKAQRSTALWIIFNKMWNNTNEKRSVLLIYWILENKIQAMFRVWAYNWYSFTLEGYFSVQCNSCT